MQIWRTDARCQGGEGHARPTLAHQGLDWLGGRKWKHFPCELCWVGRVGPAGGYRAEEPSGQSWALF